MMMRVLLSLAVLLALCALCVTSSAGQGNGSTREGAADASASASTESATTATLKLIEATLDSGLTLKSVYFPTALPLAGEPRGGLVPSQQRLLAQLAHDFKRYRSLRPDAHLVLEAHSDPRGGVLYNHALAQRRADCVKSFLVEQGIDDAAIQIKVPPAVRNPAKGPPDNRHSRRVDLVLGTTGQRSTQLQDR